MRRLMLAAMALLAVPGAAGAQARDADWANLARYRGANAALPATAPGRVVFIGDSITDFWIKEPLFTASPAHVDRGISGQTAPQMLVRFPSDVIALHPAVVHIMAGTNDVAGNTGPETDAEIEGYIAAMVDLALAHRIKVVLASIPPAIAFPWQPSLRPAPRIMAINAWLKAFAATRRIVYLDYWTAIATPEGGMRPEYSGDGVHPNPAGYAAMQPLAEKAIRQALGR